MWIFTSNAMLSIVQKPNDKMLTVRARAPGDIEEIFPDAKVTEGGGTDYRFRARIGRKAVADMIHHQVMTLKYPNFKGTVKDDDRHDCYLGVWREMMRYQYKMGGGKRNNRNQPEFDYY